MIHYRNEEAAEGGVPALRSVVVGAMTDLGVLWERIGDQGRRDARERIAHLLYEMLVRYRVSGATKGQSIDFPITQAHLADATGMTSSHVNLVLQRFREDGLTELRSRTLTITNPRRLKSLGQFNATYLHPDRTEANDPPVASRVATFSSRVNLGDGTFSTIGRIGGI